jgi:DMSO/TMAO reductase YedYZ molybdopterin-dependent catalytic subunit
MNRRRFLTLGGAALGSTMLAGCDRLSEQDSWFRKMMAGGEDVTMAVQRAILPRDRLAAEFSEAEISPEFRANGTTRPRDEDYVRLLMNNFADWKLDVRGLVERPQQFSLADLRAMPARTQITRHDCVEGWSCIGKWTGPQLSHVLDLVGLKPEAKFLVFWCYDKLEQTLDDSGRYYESIDLIDARHPQTILAYEMNGATLPVPHGAPLRLRVERQLGYKAAKYISAIEAVDSFAEFGRGRGSYWADRGYEWYAGI